MPDLKMLAERAAEDATYQSGIRRGRFEQLEEDKVELARLKDELATTRKALDALRTKFMSLKAAVLKGILEEAAEIEKETTDAQARS